MEFKVYTRRFVDDLVAVGEEGFYLPDSSIHEKAFPAFDLKGYALGYLDEKEAQEWVLYSDQRWADWDVASGPNVNSLINRIGGEDRIKRILDKMAAERMPSEA